MFKRKQFCKFRIQFDSKFNSRSSKELDVKYIIVKNLIVDLEPILDVASTLCPVTFMRKTDMEFTDVLSFV